MFCQRGSNSDNVFFYLNNIKNSAHQCQIALKAGHHRPTSETPFKWPIIECWLGSFVIFQGILTSIAKKHYIFCDFSGRVQTPCPSPSGSVHGVVIYDQVYDVETV